MITPEITWLKISWSFDIDGFNFQTDSCIEMGDIFSVVLTPKEKDGWNIESIVTVLESSDSSTLLSADYNVNRWVDNDRGPSAEQFILNLV